METGEALLSAIMALAERDHHAGGVVDISELTALAELATEARAAGAQAVRTLVFSLVVVVVVLVGVLFAAAVASSASALPYACRLTLVPLLVPGP